MRLSVAQKCKSSAGPLADGRRVVKALKSVLTPAEVGAELGISDDSVYRLISAGEISTFDAGTAQRSRTRITRRALEEFIARREARAAAARRQLA